MEEDKTEFQDVDGEERIINTDKIYDLLSFYKIPLVFALLAVFFFGGALIIWQLNNKSARVIFTQEESASTSSKIKADIEGAVARPGVYELASGSRVQDLLISAGGLAAGADREWLAKNLNQAAKLIDGGKIYIPTVNQNKKGDIGIGNQELVNKQISINSASLNELDTLPGVGPVTAQKIIDNRPYQTLEELVSKKAVGQSVFEKIKDKITLY